MPPRSMPSVSGVVPSIQSCAQVVGILGAEVLEVLADRSLGHAVEAREVARSRQVGPMAGGAGRLRLEISASPTAGSGPALAPGAEALAPGIANGGFSPDRFEAR